MFNNFGRTKKIVNNTNKENQVKREEIKSKQETQGIKGGSKGKYKGTISSLSPIKEQKGIKETQRINVLYGFSNGWLKGFQNGFNKQSELISKSISLGHKEIITGESPYIKQMMKSMIEKSEKINNLIVYINTHAIKKNGHEILLFKGETQFLDDDFTNLMIQHKANRLIIIMETCYAGGILNDVHSIEFNHENILCFSTSSATQRSYYSRILGGMTTNYLYSQLPECYNMKPLDVIQQINLNAELNQTANLTGNANKSYWFNKEEKKDNPTMLN